METEKKSKKILGKVLSEMKKPRFWVEVALGGITISSVIFAVKAQKKYRNMLKEIEILEKNNKVLGREVNKMNYFLGKEVGKNLK